VELILVDAAVAVRMTLAIGRFLENPVDWHRDPSPADKRLILDRIKEAVSKKLTRFCVFQLRKKAQPDRQIAYAFRGTGSTFDRRVKSRTFTSDGCRSP
jgi:hypothetical protein